MTPNTIFSPSYGFITCLYYYTALQFWLFTVPQAILTMISAILAFMATSELFDAKTKIIINTIVGSASGIVVFLQTMSGVCDYGIRASMHQTTALSLRSLGDDLSLVGIEEKAKYYNRKNSDDDDDDDNDDENNDSFINTRYNYQHNEATVLLFKE